MKKYLVFGFIIMAVAMLVVMPAFSQEEAKQAAANTAAASAASSAPAAPSAPAVPVTTQEPVKTADVSLYGEVQTVSVDKNSMSVQYYDYDNDEEKTVEITVDKDTKLENVKALSEINKGDWVDVTYAAVGGKNTAKMVSVEKEELAADQTAPVME